VNLKTNNMIITADEAKKRSLPLYNAIRGIETEILNACTQNLTHVYVSVGKMKNEIINELKNKGYRITELTEIISGKNLKIEWN
jgi:ribosomal protein S8